MTGFSFDPTPSPGTNRTAPVTDCATCGGDRFVPATDDPHGAYSRCSDCNPAPDMRVPVQDARWKTYDR